MSSLQMWMVGHKAAERYKGINDVETEGDEKQDCDSDEIGRVVWRTNRG